MSGRCSSARRALLALAFALGSAALPARAAAQEAPELVVELNGASLERIQPSMLRGFAAVPLDAVREIGWTASERDGRIALRGPEGTEVELAVGSPFLHWDGRALQLVDAPYEERGTVWVPLQLLVDVLPERAPERYAYDAGRALLRVSDRAGTDRPGPAGAPPREGVAPPPTSAGGPLPAGGAAPSGGEGARPATQSPGPAAGGAGGTPTGGPAAPPSDGGDAPGGEAVANGPSTYDGVRLVVIDPGHGGADPGALGPGGIREKDVALGISRYLSEILGRQEKIEVRMTRSDDSFVEVWDRGLMATELRGERPGVFVSIHANSFPARRSARGFETYFLSDARTEHEQRVAAIENAPLSIRGRGVDVTRESDLDFIFRELRNFDHAHWSRLLAQLVQDELRSFHPGPDRGVKQGPLAVLTNALMPAVLIEVGYLSNQDEGRLVAQEEFQRNTAEAVADAILAFFERYPPGSGAGAPR